MADRYAFIPVLGPAEPGEVKTAPEFVPDAAGQSGAYFWLDDRGEARLSGARRSVRGRLLARLRPLDPGRSSAHRRAGVLVPLVPELRVNGVRPLQLRVIQPGDLLATGSHHWLVARRHTPALEPPPPEIADSPCPVCGLELSAARTVVAHECGLFFHLDNPDGDPESETELNCFLTAGTCGQCRRPVTFEERLVPEPAAWRMGAGKGAKR
jgi:hypothetical protein